MLEPLAGRLKWERVNDGIRVVIPASNDLRVYLKEFAPIVAVVAALYAFALIAVWAYRAHPRTYRWDDLWYVSLAMAVGTLSTIVFRRSAVLLSPVNLRLERPGFLSKRVQDFNARYVYNLRYVEPGPGGAVHNRYRQTEIQFDWQGRTESFGAGITAEEALALIALMMQTCHFPKAPTLQTR